MIRMDLTKQERFLPMANSGDRLKQKTVAIIGLGGLGSHSAEYMVRMGVGSIVLIDNDIVEPSNLPRQGFYTAAHGQEQVRKVEIVAEELQKINPELQVQAHDALLTSANIAHLLQGVDLVLDGTDNLHARYLINDFCYESNIPWVYASATASMGTIINFLPGITPCFRCVFGDVQEDSASCDQNGVILPVLTMITSLQATEAMKILLDQKPSTEEIRFDVWTHELRSVPTTIFEDDDCACQHGFTPTKSPRLYMICSGDSIQLNSEYTLDQMASLFSSWGYRIRKETEAIVETMIQDRKRIVGFKNGKIVFHYVTKDEIKKLIEVG